MALSDRGPRTYKSEYGFFLLKNMNSCQLINGTILCNPSAMIKVDKSSDTCITTLYSSDCRYFTNYECEKVEDICSFQRTTNFKEFTHISENKFFAIFKRNSKLKFKEGEVNYIYKCEDGRQELGNAAVINVKVLVPVLVKGQLNRLFYVPKNILESQEVEYLKDQSMKNLVVSTDRGSRSYNSEYGFFLLKNMDSCQLFNETFLCDPSAMIKVEKSSDTCITSLYFSDCKYFTNNDCRKVYEKCSFEKTTNFKEFTHISENIFFAIFKRNSKLNFKEGEVNYIYKCEDGRQELGTLIFDKWVTNKFTGTVEVEENCSLITAHFQ
uniref:Uncharacterized protein n=1 Tax=Megaselia scalaris TaxID=36166 RepID=T1GSJ5_MEGSC